MTASDTLVEIVVTHSRLDAAAAPAFKQEVAGMLEGRPNRLLIDIAKVDFVDSTGLGTLVGLLKKMGTGGRIALVGVTPAVKRLLEITRLDSLFVVCADLAEARNALLG
jgi:anti-sigma B factor antagonist